MNASLSILESAIFLIRILVTALPSYRHSLPILGLPNLPARYENVGGLSLRSNAVGRNYNLQDETDLNDTSE